MKLEELLTAHEGFFFSVVWKQSDLGFPAARTFGYTILPENFHLMLKVMNTLTERFY